MPGMLFHAALWGTGCEELLLLSWDKKSLFRYVHECLLTFSIYSQSYYPKTILSSVSDSVQRPNNLTRILLFSSSSACLSWAISFCSCSCSASWRLRSISQPVYPQASASGIVSAHSAPGECVLSDHVDFLHVPHCAFCVSFCFNSPMPDQFTGFKLLSSVPPVR